MVYSLQLLKVKLKDFISKNRDDDNGWVSPSANWSLVDMWVTCNVPFFTNSRTGRGIFPNWKCKKMDLDVLFQFLKKILNVTLWLCTSSWRNGSDRVGERKQVFEIWWCIFESKLKALNKGITFRIRLGFLNKYTKTYLYFCNESFTFEFLYNVGQNYWCMKLRWRDPKLPVCLLIEALENLLQWSESHISLNRWI